MDICIEIQSSIKHIQNSTDKGKLISLEPCLCLDSSVVYLK